MLVLIPFVGFPQAENNYSINKLEQVSAKFGIQLKKSTENKLQQPPVQTVLGNAYQLDSINKYHFTRLTDSSLVNKEYYQYDHNGFQTLDIYFNWDNKWINNWKRETAFD